ISNVGNQEIIFLTMAIVCHTSLKSLDITSEYINNEGLKYLFTAMTLTDTSLEKINLMGISLKKKELTGLYKALSTTRTIRDLNLQETIYPGFSNEELQLLQTIIETCSLQKLTLANNALEDKHLKYVCEGIAKNSALKTIDLS